MEITKTFYKEEDGRWYVDLPEYIAAGGEKPDLEMVAGADTMLDIYAQGEGECVVTLSSTEVEGYDMIERTELTPEIGGAMYQTNTLNGIEYDFPLWLCAVTEFVFDEMPEKIWLKN